MSKYSFMRREDISSKDFDSITTEGMYYFYEPKGNNHPTKCQYGGVVVYNFLNNFIIQKAFDIYGSIEFRGRSANRVWSDWTVIK